MIEKYKKKPIEVYALKYDGDNTREVFDWVYTSMKIQVKENGDLVLGTLEGDMKISVGDYVVRGVKGEFWSVRLDIFELTYEPVVPKIEFAFDERSLTSFQEKYKVLEKFIKDQNQVVINHHGINCDHVFGYVDETCCWMITCDNADVPSNKRKKKKCVLEDSWLDKNISCKYQKKIFSDNEFDFIQYLIEEE